VASLKEQALAAGHVAGDGECGLCGCTPCRCCHQARQKSAGIQTDPGHIYSRAVPEWKVKQAQTLYRQHLPLLTKIGREYGVQPVLLLPCGIETNFGKITGHYPYLFSLDPGLGRSP
jgi:membrane-bound lytic murein transglycosylase B